MSTDPHAAAKDQDATFVPGQTGENNLDETYTPPAEGAPQTVAGDAGGAAANDQSFQQSPPSTSNLAPSKTQSGTGPQKVTKVGDFQLMKKLGQGGMGTVYLAKQVSLDRKVAIKTLSKELAKREDFVGRFLREARSMAKLDHPNIVKVFAAESVHGMHFAAIEYVDGQSMQDWMDEKRKLSIGDAVLVTMVTAEALKHAHELNMIHRDIKPDNILVTKKGIIKVADFGLAKAMDEDVSMTASGTGLGTPLYMPPEQARNAKHVDQRTDIYALGCTLYYMLTGELPFKADNTIELITLKEKGMFTSAKKLVPEIPDGLDLIIDKSMAKNPDQRYSTVEEMLSNMASLNIANEALSFIDDAVPASMARSVGNTTQMGAKKKTRTGSADSRAEAVRKKQESTATKKFQVVYKNPEGKPIVAVMTAQQVLKAFKSGILDLESKARKSKKDQYLPLAQFAEFADVVNAKAAHVVAEKQKSNISEQVAKLERKRKWQQRLKPITNMVKGGMGLMGLLLWLAFVFGIIGGLGFAAWKWGPDLLKQFGMGGG
ncbi:serine/threonine protein kinase [Calycomorphotria hydatis]|uniref:non-specific serine/threonine protein kinase n=1 Tax=Calycomorphotria hydatis TaxID=2528027 RepID=A0A517T5S1_9PLAN|nr:serine/threonine-protein kinase [Calycomorphotria hydatis]QDT63714.1 Serine/threonine-protein kinase PrkC [Calycomorphotria hydatis]